MALKVATVDFLSSAWPHQFQTPEEKGYPKVFNLMTYWVLYNNDEPVAYTGSLDMGKFHFVGNTYILPQYRKNGWHSHLLAHRNENLEPKPKITILNPIDGSQMFHLVKVVEGLGYIPVCTYEGVRDIMSEKLYRVILNENQQIWRKD